MLLNNSNCITIKDISDNGVLLLKSLLFDLNQINQTGKFPELGIEYIEEHTDYSPERVDPCPDYYGMYRLFKVKTGDTVGEPMTLNDLDFVLCILFELSE